MIGNIKINVWFGVFGFLITFLFSLSNNLWTTSLVRGCLGFILWFALAFLLRFILGVLATPGNATGKPPASGAAAQMGEDLEEQPSANDQGRGNMLDITTPDQDHELNDLLTPKPSHSGGDTGFAPLDPPKLVTTKEQDPEELAKALRHLTQK